MKRILFIHVMALLCAVQSQAQNSLNSGDFSTGSWGSGQSMSASAGTSLIITKGVTTAGDKYFRFFGDGSPCGEYQPNTNGDFFTHNVAVTTPNANCGNSNAWRINVPTTTSNVVFKTDGGNDGMDRAIAYVIQGTVQSVSSVAQSPVTASVFPGQAVTVTATLSGAFATGQAAYLRYTNNSYSTSTVVAMTGSGTSYTATIPAATNTAGASVSYYVFTSGNTAPASNGSDADFSTINLNNNSGSNYTYTVASGWTTAAAGNWSAAATWTAGAVPPTATDMGVITINHSVTQDANALASGITISATGTLTASANTLTISKNTSSTTFTNSGSTALSGTHTVTFAGTATHAISGTVAFQNVSTTAGVNFGGSSTINGTFTINSGGFVSTSAPTYATNSTLNYNTGGAYGAAVEWTANANSGQGVPFNVTLTTASTNVNFAASTQYRRVRGSITISASTTLTLSTAAGGDLKISGNWTNGGILTANSRAVYFDGTTAQTINATGSFAYLFISNTAATVTAAGAITATASLTVDANATLDLGTNALTLTGSTSTINGTLKRGQTANGAFTGVTATTLTFSSTGVYDHNFTTVTGTIPTATWSTGSTCKITGYTSTAVTINSSFSQAFSNFTWECTGQTVSINLLGLLTTVNGNFNLASTGTGSITYNSNSPATPVLTIGGNCTINANINMNNGTSTPVWNIAGNFSHTGGTISKAGGGVTTLTFNKASGTQTITQSGGSITGALVWNLGNGTTTNTVQLATNLNAGSGAHTVNAANNASVDFQSFVLSGSGTFAAATGSTLITANANGLNSSGASGSVQTTTRTFTNTGVNYSFNGASAQVAGTALVAAASIANLTVNNTAGLTLSSNVQSLTGALTFTNGKLTLSTFDLNLGASATIGSASSTKYVVTDNTGQLKKASLTTAFTFPVGNSAYNPITITNTGTSDTYGVIVGDGTVPAATISSAAVNRRWIITEGTAGGGNLSVTAQYNTGETGGTYSTGAQVYVGLYVPSTWTTTTTTVSGSNPFTAAGSGFTQSLPTSGITAYFAIGNEGMGLTAPTVTTTTTASSITNNTASTGGQGITGSSLSAKGVVYSTAAVSTSPTLSNDVLTDGGTTTANFTSNLTGLSAQTQYYVRAYATNAAGTGYGPAINFRTLSNPATAQASGLSATASASGELTISWTGATFPSSGATQGGYALIYGTGSPTLSSANGNAPAAGVGTLITITPTNLPTAPATSYVLSGLTGGTSYNFLLVPFTWDGTNAATYNYLTTSAPTASATAITNPAITTTTAISAITSSSASSGGSGITANGGTISAKGVVWNTSTAPTTANSSTTDGTGTASFSSSLTSLSAQTLYYVRSYATNDVGTAYGNELTFYTLSNEPTAAASSFTATANGSSQIDLSWTAGTFPGAGASNSGYIILRRIDSTNPTTTSVTDGIAPASLSLPSGTTLVTTITAGTTTSYNHTGLAASTQYNYIIIPFTWNGSNAATYNYYLTSAPNANATTDAGFPTVDITTAASSITNNSASSGGSDLIEGGSAITAKGVAYNTTGTPTTANNTTSNGSGTANFTSSLTGLSAQTLYYVRAYVTNSAGTGYGNEISFRTLSNPATAQASGLTATASAAGELTINWTGATFPSSGATQGGYALIYATGSPTLSSANGNAPAAGVGTLITITPTNLPTAPATSYVLSGLTGGTTYNFLLVPFTWNGANATTYNYLTASAPTTSGLAVTAATVTTTALSSITASTANSGGGSIGAGGGSISAKGVVWNTATAPTLANSSTSNGTGTAAYTSNLTSLSAETLYYVRAYVTNELGTSYGNELTFRTLSTAPTAQASGLSASATSASNIDLTWTAATFPGTGASATGYVLLRATSPNTPSLGNSNGAAPTAGANTTIVSSSISGAATSASSTGLSALTAYNYLLVPFTWDGSNASTYNYLTTSAPIANATTFASLPIAQPSGLSFTAVTATTITTSWTAAGGGPSGYIVLRSTGSAPDTDPVSGTSYTAGNTLGNATVVYVGAPVTTGAQTGLVDGTTYFYEVYSYNGSGSTRNYLTTSPLSGSQATTAVSAPTATAGTSITDSGFTANWNSVAGASSYELDVFPLTYDSFDNTTTLFSVTSGTGAYYTGSSAAADAPGTTTFVSNGTHSFGKSNGSVSVTSSNINTTALASPQLSFKVASFSITSTGNGADGGDYVTVEISADGGNTYSSTVRVQGNTNARWSFTSGTGVASTAYDGDATPVDFTPAGGGARTTDGYSTVTVTGLPSTANMRVRITLLNNTANERWLIDNFTISPAPANVSGYSSLSVSGTTQTVTGLASNTTYGYVVRAVGTNTTSGNSNTIAVTTLVGQSDADYRSIASGNFSTASNWEYNNGTSWVTATQSPSANNSTTIQAAHTITMDVTHTMNAGKTMTVNGALDAGTYVISGGIFTLASAATLTIGSADGIATSGATGNIQTTTRTFNAAANYIYAGVAAQITGTALPTTITGSLAIQSGSNTVTMTNTPTTTDSLSLQSGLFAIGSGATLNISANGKVVAASGDFATGATGGTINFVGLGSFSGSCNPYNVYANNGVNFGSGTVTIQNGGTFRINSGGYVDTNAPFYGTGSTLQYNVGATYGRNLEWSSSSGRGYPHHVTVSNNTTLNPAGTAGANAGVALQTAGGLTIDSGSSFYMDFGGNNMTVDLVVLGDMTMNGNCSGSGASGSDIFVGGNWTNNGTSANFFPNSRAVFLNGTGAQTIAGTNASFPAFPYLFIDKTAGSVTLSRDVQVSTQLVLSSSNVANINAGSFTLNVSGTATTALDRQGSGHVIGNLRRGIGTGTNSYAYPIGDASNYTPVTLDFNNVTGAGNVTLKSTAAEQSQIGSSGLDSTLSVNRYFTATNNSTTFTSYTATLNFVSGDRDAGITTNDLLVGLYNSTWSYPTVGTITATSIQASGVSSFGDFAIAECKSPAIYSVTGGGEYCSGGSGVDVSITDSELGVSYQLKRNGVNVGSAVPGTGVSLSFGNQTTAGVYTVVGNSLATSGCNNAMTDSALVNVNTVVVPTLAISASATTFCDGTSVTFTATPQFGGATPSYQWKVNGSNVGTDNATFTSTTLTDGDAVTCVLTSSEECPSPSTATSNSIEVTVVSYETPSITIGISAGTTICSGDLVTITSTPLFGGGLPTFDWLVNGVSTGNNDSTYTTFSLNNGDQVSCIFTSDFLCTTVGADTSNTLTFTIVTPPQVDAGSNMTTCGTTAFTFANGATNSNTTSIAWTENGAGSITAGANTLTPTYTPAAGDLGTTVTFTLTGYGNSPCAEIADNVTLQIDALTLYYDDDDNDGFGDPLSSPVASCTPVSGKAANNTDCCDSNADVNPMSEWWADADGDGVGGFIFATGCISGCSGFASTIPYYPGAHGGAPYGIDCNDASSTAYPGATELCGNAIDDDCDQTIDEGCSGIVNDGFAYATLMNVNSTNAYYPNCQSVNGSVLNADISSEGNPANVAVGGGRDSWYRFVAPSSAARIRVVPTGFDAVIELRTAAHPAGQVDVENANATVGGTEIMNVSGLTIGQTYYIAVRNYDASTGGTFTICVSPLMPSGCGTAQPTGGYSLCTSYKAVYRGATSYTFNFTGAGGTAPTPFATTSATVANGLITLSNPLLALRNGGIYNIRVDVNYTLLNGAGVADPTITILGPTTNCLNRTIVSAPLLEVRSTQRCPVTLFRSTYLAATPVAGNTNACGAIAYNYRFTRVTDCTGTTTSGSPFVVTTPNASAFLSLYAAFPNSTYPLPNLGYWKVEVAPVFSYGATAYGPPQVIQVNNTASSTMLPEEAIAAERSETIAANIELYPNPGDGGRVIVSAPSEMPITQWAIFDELGRKVEGYQVIPMDDVHYELVFDNALATGLYYITWQADGEMQNKKWVVSGR